MNTKRSIFRSARRRSAHEVRDPTGLRDKAVSRSAWYPDPFGVAAERWWDGGRWTQEVRGEAQAMAAGTAPDGRRVNRTIQPPETGRRPARAAGWYPRRADAMRYWDGERWGEYRPRAGAELPTAEAAKQRQSWLVPFGYVAAVFLPVVGLTFGIVVVLQPGERSPTRHGIQIIALSLVVFALGLLLARHS